jgi:hypothetical protein
MKKPVFHVQEEVLTDAPLEELCDRLETGLPCLRACPGLRAPERTGEGLVLRWHRHAFGTVEEGTLRVSPAEAGAHLRMDLRLRGWGAFLLVGPARFRTDGLLDRIVRSL